MSTATSDQVRNARLGQHLREWEHVRAQTLTRDERMQALHGLLRMALDLCQGDSGSIMITDESGRELRLEVSEGLSLAPGERPSVRVGEPIAGRVAESGRPLLVHSDRPTPDFDSFLQRRGVVQSAACVPLSVGNAVRGVLTANRHRNGRDTIDEVDVEFLQVLGNYAAKDVLQLPASTSDAAWAADPETQERIDRLASLGLVAGGIAHEINNPLQGALGEVELLWQTLDPAWGEEVRERVSELRKLLDRLTDTVVNVLSFVRTSEGGDRPVTEDVAGCLDFAIRLALGRTATARIRCVRDFDKHLPPVALSPVLLRQVMLNLVVNAVQAMEREGALRVAAHPCELEQQLEILVADTGPGIAPEHLERIFEPGFTTKDRGKGTGLGLAVSKRLCEAHGGALTVKSHLGAGAEFTVRLPLAPEPEAITLEEALLHGASIGG